MPTYECDNCIYSTIIITHFNKHLKTQKHINNIANLAYKSLPSSQKEHKKSTNEHKKSTNEHKIIIKCDYCPNQFATMANKRRHEKNYCKNIDNINEKNKLKKILKTHQKEIEQKDKTHKTELDRLHKQIELLLEQKPTTNIINIEKQINLNSYGNEDLTHITNAYKNSLLKIPYGAISKMIEKVHFNDKIPENKNIKLPNKKDNLIKVYQGDKWIFKDKKTTITNLVDEKYYIIDDHYEGVLNTDPQYTNKNYKKFRDLYDSGDKDLGTQIKMDCELILLNNR